MARILPVPPPDSKLAPTPTRKQLLLVLIAFSIAGAWLVQSSRGIASITWERIYAVCDADSWETTCDVDSWEETVAYVRDLQIPISLPLSLAEIASYNLFGSDALVTCFAYRAALVLSFVLSIYLAATSRWKMVIAFLLSLAFLWCTVLIHPGNSQVYDIFFPSLCLTYIVLLMWIVRRPASQQFSKRTAMLCFAAGFVLSMTELTRPFVFLLLPVLLLGAYQTLRERPRHCLLCFLAPVVLFSGAWHLYIAYQHGQITWSNHAGFNICRAWPMVEKPELVPENNNQPLQPGRLENLNTAEHGENSRRLQAAVVNYIATHPRQSIKHGITLMQRFFAAPTEFYTARQSSPLFLLYRPFVWTASLWLFANALWLGIRAIRHPLIALGRPENILILVTVFSILVMALGEDGEQARFLISVLPMLTVLPRSVTSTKPSVSAIEMPHSVATTLKNAA